MLARQRPAREEGCVVDAVEDPIGPEAEQVGVVPDVPPTAEVLRWNLIDAWPDLRDRLDR